MIRLTTNKFHFARTAVQILIWIAVKHWHPWSSLGKCGVQKDIAPNYHLPEEKPTLELLDTQNISRNFTPVDYLFLFFFDRDLYNMIVEQSNLNLRPQDMRGQVTTDLLSKFIGFLTYSVCVDLGSKDRYWSYGLLQQNVVENVSTNNMKLIKKALHFNDSALLPEITSLKFDNLYKIRPLVDYLNNRYKAVVNSEREQCIDEQMTLYKGRKTPTGLKQCTPAKPIQHGFKNWARCGASGYNKK